MSLDILVPIIGAGAAALAHHLLSDKDEAVENKQLVTQLSCRGGYIDADGHALVFAGELLPQAASLVDPVALIYLMHDELHYQASNRQNADADGDLLAAANLYQFARVVRFNARFAGDAYRRIRRHPPPPPLVVIADQGRILSRQHFTFGRGRQLIGDQKPHKMGHLAFHMANLVRLGGHAKSGSYKGMIKSARKRFNLTETGMDQLRDLIKQQSRYTATMQEIEAIHDDMFDEDCLMDQEIESFIAAMLADEIRQHDHYHTHQHAALLRAVASHRLSTELCQSVMTLAEHIDDFLSAQHDDEAAKSAAAAQQRSDALHKLGVSEDASDTEIKAAWRALMKQLHPDKLRHMPDAARRVLEKEVRAINDAYDQLVKQK